MNWFADNFWLLLGPMVLVYLIAGVVVARIEDRVRVRLGDASREDREARTNGAIFTIFAWPIIVVFGSLVLLWLGASRVAKKALGTNITGEEEEPYREFPIKNVSRPEDESIKPHPHPLHPQYVIRPPDSPTRRLDLKEMHK